MKALPGAGQLFARDLFLSSKLISDLQQHRRGSFRTLLPASARRPRQNPFSQAAEHATLFAACCQSRPPRTMVQSDTATRVKILFVTPLHKRLAPTGQLLPDAIIMLLQLASGPTLPPCKLGRFLLLARFIMNHDSVLPPSF